MCNLNYTHMAIIINLISNFNRVKIYSKTHVQASSAYTLTAYIVNILLRALHKKKN